MKTQRFVTSHATAVVLGIVFAVLNPCLKRRKTPKGVVFVDGDGTGETGRQNRKPVFQQYLRILCACFEAFDKVKMFFILRTWR